MVLILPRVFQLVHDLEILGSALWLTQDFFLQALAPEWIIFKIEAILNFIYFFLYLLWSLIFLLNN